MSQAQRAPVLAARAAVDGRDKAEQQQQQKKKQQQPLMAEYALSLAVVFGGWMVALFGVAGSARPGGVLAFALVAGAGVGFVATSVLLVRWRVDRLGWVASLMEDRVMRARENWASDPLRSLLEVGGWLHLTFRMHAVTGSALMAAVAGTGAGAFCVVMGELSTELARKLAPQPTAASASLLLTPQAVSLACAVVLAGSLWHAEESQDLGLALILAAMANVAFVTAERLLAFWQPSGRTAALLRDRAVNVRQNWQHHTLRSGFETSAYLGCVFAAFAVWESAPAAALVGALGGILVVLSSERLGFEPSGASPSSSRTAPPPGGFAAIVFAWACVALLYTVLTLSRSALLAILVVAPTAVALFCVAALLAASSAQEQTDQKLPPSKLSALAFTLRALLPPDALGATPQPPSLPPVRMADVRADEAVAAAERLAQDAKWEAVLRNRHGSSVPTLSREEIRGRACVTMDGFVLDVSKFAASHPGGEALLRDFAERNADISDQFAAFHHPAVRARLPALLVGRLAPEDEEQHGMTEQGARSTDAYRLLRSYLWRHGYFDGAERDGESARSCVQQHLVVLSLLVLTVCQVLLLREASSSTGEGLIRAVLAGVSLGFFWQQVAFIAHDALHNGVVGRTREARPRSRWVPHNVLGWLHGSVCFGISAAMWLDEHSVHHALTMRPCADAQFNYLPLWAVSMKEFATRHWKDMRASVIFLPSLTRALVAVQHWTLLPLAVIIGRFNFYLINIGYALRHAVYCDLAGMALFWTALSALAWQLEGGLAAAFLLTAHWTVGILHVQLLVNHLGTDALFAEEETRLGWFLFQLRTTRNIEASPRTEWFHGGLHYQIEHHLAPQLPRHRLALAKPAVVEICRENGIQYESTSFFEAVRRSLASFKDIAHEVWQGNLAT